MNEYQLARRTSYDDTRRRRASEDQTSSGAYLPQSYHLENLRRSSFDWTRPRSAPNSSYSRQIVTDDHSFPNPTFEDQCWMEGSSSAPYTPPNEPDFRYSYPTPPGSGSPLAAMFAYGISDSDPHTNSYAHRVSPDSDRSYHCRSLTPDRGSGIYYSDLALPPCSPVSTRSILSSHEFSEAIPNIASGSRLRSRMTPPPEHTHTGADPFQVALTLPTLPNVMTRLSTPPGAGAGGKRFEKLACFSCRRGKIGCRRPSPEATDQRCEHCIRRGNENCSYPISSNRGSHWKEKKEAMMLKFAQRHKPS